MVGKGQRQKIKKSLSVEQKTSCFMPRLNLCDRSRQTRGNNKGTHEQHANTAEHCRRGRLPAVSRRAKRNKSEPAKAGTRKRLEETDSLPGSEVRATGISETISGRKRSGPCRKRRACHGAEVGAGVNRKRETAEGGAPEGQLPERPSRPGSCLAGKEDEQRNE